VPRNFDDEEAKANFQAAWATSKAANAQPHLAYSINWLAKHSKTHLACRITHTGVDSRHIGIMRKPKLRYRFFRASDGEKAFWRWEVYRRKVVLEAGTLYGNADNAKNAAEAAIIRLSHADSPSARDSDSE
jgi:hypothetical protein